MLATVKNESKFLALRYKQFCWHDSQAKPVSFKVVVMTPNYQSAQII
jgi:hypothetical protein